MPRLFGDGRVSYSEAVKTHYARDEYETADWVGTHISRYATMHPYEDWAESFVHYLHVLDALQTAANFHLGPTSEVADPDLARPPGSFGSVIEGWLSLSYGLNQVNESMGRSVLYPFVLSPMVIRKLSFVDLVVRHWQKGPQAGAAVSAGSAWDGVRRMEVPGEVPLAIWSTTTGSCSYLIEHRIA